MAVTTATHRPTAVAEKFSRPTYNVCQLAESKGSTNSGSIQIWEKRLVCKHEQLVSVTWNRPNLSYRPMFGVVYIVNTETESVTLDARFIALVGRAL